MVQGGAGFEVSCGVRSPRVWGTKQELHSAKDLSIGQQECILIDSSATAGPEMRTWQGPHLSGRFWQ